MNDATHANTVRDTLRRATRRLSWLAAARGMCGAFIAAAAALLLGWPGHFSASPGNAAAMDASLLPALAVVAAFLLVGVGIALVITPPSRTTSARMIERAAPQCQNLLVTAEELLHTPDRVTPAVFALVQREAARLLERVHVATLFPARSTVVALGASLALWGIALWIAALLPRDVVTGASARLVSRSNAPPAVQSVQVVVTPPLYTAQPPRTERDPTRIDAVAGSQLLVTVVANADTVAIETVHGTSVLTRSGSREFRGTFVADADGFLAIEPRVRADSAGARRLIGLSVSPDRAPRVRVSAPGHDVRFPDANHTLTLRVDADDDFGLASLRLTYTKVSGSGERFAFTDGELPLTVTRPDSRNWNADGALALATLDLTAGDMVVYRAVVTDRRPGAPTVESDAYIAEITALGAIAAPGFAIDNEQNRYALSQQMVILKTQRLLDRRAATAPDVFAAEALELASEQRRVRAEFVFMMGGELADEVASDANMSGLNETAEAESEGDLAAGRMANQGRVALLRAIREMSRAATALTTTNVPDALVDEKRALVQIERAFSRSRIILRALTERESLDMTRRLSGVLTSVGRDSRRQAVPDANVLVTGLRGVLADLADVVRDGTMSPDASSRLARSAQRILQLDPSSKPLQEIASQLTTSSVALVRGNAAETRGLIDRSSVQIGEALRRESAVSAARVDGIEARVLEGVLRDVRSAPGAVVRATTGSSARAVLPAPP